VFESFSPFVSLASIGTTVGTTVGLPRLNERCRMLFFRPWPTTTTTTVNAAATAKIATTARIEGN
jgi:hypothetical protein